MQRINETRNIIWHETCKYVYRLTSSVCNSRKIWNEDKFRCECKEDLIDKGICDKGFIWDSSNYEFECDRSCGIREYLDYKSCVCRNTLIEKLLEECPSVIGENIVYNETLNTVSSNDCASYTVYFVLFAAFLTTSIINGSSFLYFYWYSKKEDNVSSVKFNPGKQTTIY